MAGWLMGEDDGSRSCRKPFSDRNPARWREMTMLYPWVQVVVVVVVVGMDREKQPRSSPKRRRFVVFVCLLSATARTGSDGEGETLGER
jgi:hypothetical protein